jgi:hypothetical protein
MDIHSRVKDGFIASAVLALLSLSPGFVFARIPAGLPNSLTVQEAIQGPSLNGSLHQGAQTGGQQDPNSQSGTRTAEHIISPPPQITLEDGQLTIVAENSRLSEIMTALRTVMGADIDLPPSVARQRIWVRLGPGPVRKILRDLLDNTELDYVIQASDTDPDGIRSVLLTLRSKTTEPGAPGSRVARGTSRKSLSPEGSNPVEAPDEDSSTTAESASVTNPDAAGPPPPPTDNGASRATKIPSTPAVSDSSLGRSAGTGSSEQMIQQLQSMYQQRRQLQIQQNQKPPSNNN